jgi:hypothetical protein
MVGKGHLVLNMFDMIEHDPSCLEVTTKLHSLHQIKSTPLSINKHFEKKNLLLLQIKVF